MALGRLAHYMDEQQVWKGYAPPPGLVGEMTGREYSSDPSILQCCMQHANPIAPDLPQCSWFKIMLSNHRPQILQWKCAWMSFTACSGLVRPVCLWKHKFIRTVARSEYALLNSSKIQYIYIFIYLYYIRKRLKRRWSKIVNVIF